MNPIVSICIATWQPEGISRVTSMKLPKIPGVEWIVSWQFHDNAELPETLSRRNDLKVFRFDRKGVSANRNNALAKSSAEIAFFADDDIEYDPAELVKAIKLIIDRKEIDFGTFRYEGDGNLNWPEEECNLKKLPSKMPVSCCVMFMRRQDTGEEWPVYFDERFGPGSEMGLEASEDLKILLDARRKGLNCRYLPINICRHQGLSTGYRKPTPGVLKAEGAYIAMEWPFTGPARIFLKAHRLKQKFGLGFFNSLRFLGAGLLKGYCLK